MWFGQLKNESDDIFGYHKLTCIFKKSTHFEI